MPVTVSSSGTNLIHQISNSNYKQSIGAGDKGSFDLTVTINATLKDRMAWKKPNKEDRATIANTFLNALKMAADTGALGPNSGKVSEKDYAKLFKQLSKEGLTIRSAKKSSQTWPQVGRSPAIILSKLSLKSLSWQV